MQTKGIHPAIIKQCEQLYFRQSMLKDYLTCGMMSMYRWILNMEEEAPWMAAILGTAGHEVIFQMHEAKKFDYSYIELMDMLERAFRIAYAKMDIPPQIGAAYDSLDEQLQAVLPQYAGFLKGYQEREENNRFLSTIHEQKFVLELQPDSETVLKESGTGGDMDGFERPMLFTGTIDQAGFYPDGVFALRDIKFRADAFRPRRTDFDLDIQMTVYAAALRFGNPSCNDCNPKYDLDGNLKYDGPCDNCQKKIGTPYWPRKYAEVCHMIWMRDFERYERDEFSKMMKAPELPKVKNPLTGRMVQAEKINPKYEEGYKKGDYKGSGILKTVRSARMLDVLMSDVVRICDQIRKGVFYRKPGEVCNMWCRYAEQCKHGVELEVQEVDISKARAYGTADPFAD